MSEERAEYSFVEAHLEPKKKRFGWLHNTPQGTVCNTKDASAVRWNPECEQVVCYDCGMIFHAGASAGDELIAAVKQIFEGDLERLKWDNRTLIQRIKQREKMWIIVLALLLEAYGEPFSVPIAYLSGAEPALELHWRDEANRLSRTFWAEKCPVPETPEADDLYGRSPTESLLTQAILDLEKEKPTDA